MIVKSIAWLFLFLVFLHHAEAAAQSDIHGKYQGKAYVESGTTTENFNATVRVIETSATVTTARITFIIYGTVFDQILKFREDGSIYGVVKLDGVKEATLKGTWVLEENRYRYAGTIRVRGFSRTRITGFLNFHDEGRLTATGRLPGNERFRFIGTK